MILSAFIPSQHQYSLLDEDFSWKLTKCLQSVIFSSLY